MTSSDRRAAKLAKRARQHHRAHEARELAARLRVGPEPSTRQPDEDSAPPLAVRPFEQLITEYRQTPESWAAVWREA